MYFLLFPPSRPLCLRGSDLVTLSARLAQWWIGAYGAGYTDQVCVERAGAITMAEDGHAVATLYVGGRDILAIHTDRRHRINCDKRQFLCAGVDDEPVRGGARDDANHAILCL